MMAIVDAFIFLALAVAFVAANGLLCHILARVAATVNPHPSTAWYVPNLIGYARIAAIGVMIQRHAVGDAFGACVSYAVSATLDGYDGYFARKLGQCSKFGEALDVVADNAARAALWALVAALPHARAYAGLCALPVVLEHTCMACTHAPSYAAMTADVNWKDPAAPREPTPWLLRRIFANGFKNPLGATAVGGLFFLPFLLYVHCAVALDPAAFPGNMLPAVFGANAGGLPASPADLARWAAALPASTRALGAWLVAGRALCASAELYLVGKHARALLATDRADASRTEEEKKKAT